MRKKIYPLSAALGLAVFCFTVTQAQEKLWGIGRNVFHMNTDGSEYVQATSDKVIGDSPKGLILGPDHLFYGFTQETLFKTDKNFSFITPLTPRQDYSSSLYSYVDDIIIDGQGIIFGTGHYQDSYGFIFSVNSDGTGFKELIQFRIPGTPSGAPPSDTVNYVCCFDSRALSVVDGNDGYLYGYARLWTEGIYHDAVIFKIRKDGSDFSILRNLKDDGIGGGYGKLLVASDNNLYGMGRLDNSNGSLFRMNRNGENFITLGTFGGESPYVDGNLLQTFSGNIYGTFLQGLAEDHGFIFSYSSFGNQFDIVSDSLPMHRYVPPFQETPEGKLIAVSDTKIISFDPTHLSYEEISITIPDSLQVHIPDTTLLQTHGAFIIDHDARIYTMASTQILESGTIAFSTKSDGTDLSIDYTDQESIFFQALSITPGDDGLIYGTTFNDDGSILFRFGPDGMQALHEFENNGTGGVLVDGGDGFLYGVGGGGFGFGAMVYKIRYDGSDFQFSEVKQYDFHVGYLTRTQNGNIYGLSSGGGLNKKGFIFKLKPDVSGIEILYSFSKSEGVAPQWKLLEGQDGHLYGTARGGGAYNAGVIFKVSPTGQYVKLFDFNGNNGRWPEGELVQDEDGNIYGTTTKREKFRNGIIFRINPDGSDFTRIYEFDTSFPGGALVLGNDGFIYGNAPYSGPTARLLGFKIKKDGTGFQKLPGGILFLQSENIEATVQVINPSNDAIDVPVNGSKIVVSEVTGALKYSLQLSESPDFSAALSFNSLVNSFQVSGLQYSTKYFARVKTNAWPTYGAVTSFTTQNSPEAPPVLWGIERSLFEYAEIKNVAFTMHTDGSEFRSAFWGGAGGIGYNPIFITKTPHAIYGINQGSYNYPHNLGALFRLDANGLSPIHTFREQEITRVSLIDGGNGYVFGAGCAAGCSGVNIFRFNYEGVYEEKRVVVYGFTTSGAIMSTADHEVFGMSSGGGANNRGFIYKIRSDISGVDIIYSFSGSNGKAPDTKLIEGHDGFLYGITTTGGLYGNGVIFKVARNGQQFQKLYDFSSNKTVGANPIGTLVQDEDHHLYGICKGSGQYKKGMIFRINPDGSGFTNVYSFDGTIAADPDGNLLIDDKNNLYGVAGAKFFQIKTDGSSFIVLHEGTMDFNKLFFLMTEPVVPEVFVTTPENGSNKGYPFFAASISDMRYGMHYDLQVSSDADFSNIVFEGATSNPALVIQPPVINVFNLEYGATYYARARSSFWPYYGPVTHFTTLDKSTRLWGTFFAGGGDNSCFGIGGGTLFSMSLEGDDFIKHIDYPCGGVYPYRILRDVIPGNDNSLYGFSAGIDFPEGGEVFTISATGNYESVHPFNEFDITKVVQRESGNYDLMSERQDLDYNEFTSMFRLIPSGTASTSTLIPLHDFPADEGRVRSDLMVEMSDGFIYGIVESGLPEGGTIYKVRPDGNDFQIVQIFNDETGNRPSSIVNGNDGYLYGITEGDDGTLFRISEGGDFELLQIFNDSIGALPGKLINGNDGYIYGITLTGGANYGGSLFRITTHTGIYETLYYFQTTNGEEPQDFVILNDTIYGTSHGDVLENGNASAIFKINKDGTEHIYLYQFGGEIGDYPPQLVGYHNGYIYGKSSTTSALFRIRTNGADLQIYDLYEQGRRENQPLPNVFLYPQTILPVSSKVNTNARANASVAPDGSEKENFATIFPNPFNNGFTINVSNKDLSSCSAVITDVSGRILVKTSSFSGSVELGESLSAGFYVVRVVQGNKTSLHRIIKK